MFRRAAILLPMVAASLRLRGYKGTQGWLQNKLESRPTAPLAPELAPARLEMICRMVRAAEHYALLPSSCLEQSLLLWYLLRREGIATALRVGVRKDSGKFEAHAWVEHDGTALNQAEEPHRHYAAFDSELAKPPAEQR
jgi:Transglutaminase-like superfamily